MSRKFGRCGERGWRPLTRTSDNRIRDRFSAFNAAERATQHYAVNDYGDQHRVVRRATLDGDVALSFDGRRCVTRMWIRGRSRG